MNAAYISILDTLHTNRKGIAAFPLEQSITHQSSARVATEQIKGEKVFLHCAGFPSKFPSMEEKNHLQNPSTSVFLPSAHGFSWPLE